MPFKPDPDGLRQAERRAERFRQKVVGEDRQRGVRSTDLPKIDEVSRMTSEMHDSFGTSTGLSHDMRSRLLDMCFDNWEDLVNDLRISWMGTKHLAIASSTADCLQLTANPVAEQPGAGPESEPDVEMPAADNGSESAEAPHHRLDDAAAPIDNDMQDANARSDADCLVQCPQCQQGFTGNQSKVRLCSHLHQHCIPNRGELSEQSKARLRALDLGHCKKCDKWMARRSVNSKRHKAVCKNDQHAPDEDDAGEDSEQVKPGKYGVHGDTIPQFVHDALEASDHLGDWLQAIDWYAGEATGAQQMHLVRMVSLHSLFGYLLAQISYSSRPSASPQPLSRWTVRSLR